MVAFSIQYPLFHLRFWFHGTATRIRITCTGLGVFSKIKTSINNIRKIRTSPARASYFLRSRAYGISGIVAAQIAIEICAHGRLTRKQHGFVLKPAYPVLSIIEAGACSIAPVAAPRSALPAHPPNNPTHAHHHKYHNAQASAPAADRSSDPLLPAAQRSDPPHGDTASAEGCHRRSNGSFPMHDYFCSAIASSP